MAQVPLRKAQSMDVPTPGSSSSESDVVYEKLIVRKGQSISHDSPYAYLEDNKEESSADQPPQPITFEGYTNVDVNTGVIIGKEKWSSPSLPLPPSIPPPRPTAAPIRTSAPYAQLNLDKKVHKDSTIGSESHIYEYQPPKAKSPSPGNNSSNTNSNNPSSNSIPHDYAVPNIAPPKLPPRPDTKAPPPAPSRNPPPEYAIPNAQPTKPSSSSLLLAEPPKDKTTSPELSPPIPPRRVTDASTGAKPNASPVLPVGGPTSNNRSVTIYETPDEKEDLYGKISLSQVKVEEASTSSESVAPNPNLLGMPTPAEFGYQKHSKACKRMRALSKSQMMNRDSNIYEMLWDEDQKEDEATPSPDGGADLEPSRLSRKVSAEMIRRPKTQGKEASRASFAIDARIANSPQLEGVRIDSLIGGPKRVPSVRVASDRRGTLKTCQVFTNEVLATKTLEKAGYLAKQGHIIKTWKRRYFVLRDGELFYYSRADAPLALGRVPVTPDMTIRRCQAPDGTNRMYVFAISTPNRVYFLSASSNEEMEAWISLLVDSVKKLNTRVCSLGAPKISGIADIVKLGFVKKRWISLIGTQVFFSHGEGSKPVAAIDIGACALQIIENTDGDETEEEKQKRQYVLEVALAQEKGIYYFNFATQEERNKWLYYCSTAAGKVNASFGTATERLLSAVKKPDFSDLDMTNSVLSFSTDPLERPLTTLPTRASEQAALELNKSLLLFTGIVINTQGVDYHVSMARNIINTCIEKPELQNELYCQLLKQVTSHPYPQSSYALQCWHLLALVIPVFLPTHFFFGYLLYNLETVSARSDEIGQMAQYAGRCLERHQECGGRKRAPSRVEMLSVLTRSPLACVFPMSIPVYFPNGGHFVAGFDPSSSCLDIAEQINYALGMRPNHITGFALFCNDPQYPEEALEHSVRDHDKICDVISKWELLSKELRVGLVDAQSLPIFTYKRRLFFQHSKGGETEIERVLYAYQINEMVIDGRFPVTREEAVELACILAELEFGDSYCLEDPDGMVAEVMDRFMPKRFSTKGTGKASKKVIASNIELERAIVDGWTSLTGTSADQLGGLYLDLVSKWRLYGSSVLAAERLGKQCFLAVHEAGVSLLEGESLETQKDIPYSLLRTFGASAGDFVLALKGSGKDSQLVFKLEQRSEASLLIASYINHIITREGITSQAASVDQVVTDMESKRGTVFLTADRIMKA